MTLPSHWPRREIDAGGTTIHARIAGSGPPLLLLHGCPQTHAMWHRVAPALARRHTVVAADLRGYGASGKPPDTADHGAHSFRAMARDQVALMEALGFPRFAAAGHDRGARVLHRMALDHPGRLERVALLDVLPTRFLYEHADRELARAYWTWFFLIQAPPLPERLIGGDPAAFLDHELGDALSSGAVTRAARQAYLEALADPATVHAMCEDYRAAATIDLDHDDADADRRIECPALVLWGRANPVLDRFDVTGVWSHYAREVHGTALPCGHYLPEEAPWPVIRHLARFLDTRT